MNVTNVIIALIFGAAMKMLHREIVNWIHLDRMYSVKQMNDRGIKFGLPYTGHWGLSFDNPVFDEPVMMFIIALYADQWCASVIWMVSIIVLSAAASVGLHHWWKQGKIEDCLCCFGWMKPAGVMHVYYAWGFIAVFSMFYFVTPHVNHWFLIIVSCVLSEHIFVGSNKLLDIVAPSYWPRRITDDKAGTAIVFVAIALVWVRTVYMLKHS